MTLTGHLSEKTAVVLYDYNRRSLKELTLRKGDTITVRNTTGTWWLGKRGDTKGYIPSNFVKILEKEDVEPVETHHTSSGLL